MNYRDTLVTCSECGKQYVFTVEQQRKLADRGLEVVPPDLCGSCTQPTPQATYEGGQLHGQIKWFNPDKGYGFLVQDDGSELFVHRSGVVPTSDGSPVTLAEGQEVLYEITESPKGPQAVQVTPYP